MAAKILAELKSDALGRVELLDFAGRRWVRRVACGGALPMSGRVARWLLRRERRALERLRGLHGVPQLCDGVELAHLSSHGDGSASDIVLVRSFLEGQALHRCTELPLDFFELLEELVATLHDRGVAHNDLHKEQNIVVGTDGRPRLIDFQLASLHVPGSRALRVRAADDLRHIAKHRRRYLRYAIARDEHNAPPRELRQDPPRAPRRRGVALVWRKTGKPLYNALTRGVLGRSDGEERRATNGPWPVWTAAARGGDQSTSSR